MGFYPSFGRLTPSDDKMQLHATKYAFKVAEARFNLAVPLTIEKSLVLPEYHSFYDQGQTGGCTGWSASWEMSIYNNKKFDAYKLYKEGQKIDGDPHTSGDNDGGYIWAVHDVLKNEGHWPVGSSVPVLSEGIDSYYWIQTIDDMRTAFGAGRPLVFGIRWYNKFMTPKVINGEYWIGTESNWGTVAGGHAICSFAISDQRQAVKLVNSWGTYPDVWISYKSIQRLLGEQGECVASFDRTIAPPIPPTPEPTTDTVSVTVVKDGITYEGTLNKKE